MELILNSDINEILNRNMVSLNKMQGKKILITGAAGFLGRYFMKVFEEYNKVARYPIKIVALDNHITSLRNNDSYKVIDSHVEWIFGDAKIGSELPDRFNYILHAAGIASPAHYRTYPLETIYVAVDITRSLLNKAQRDGARFLFFSSSEIYGDPSPSEIPTTEAYRGNVSTMGPRSCYDESKRLGETLCYVYSSEFNVPAFAVRPFNVYGPGMLPMDYRVLPNFAVSLVKGTKVSVYGHGEQTRTFCYITDAITGFIKVLVDAENPTVYNVGNPDPEISMKDLAKLSCKIFNSLEDFKLVPYPSSYPEDEPNRRCPNINKISEDLGFIPEVGLKEGLTRFFTWAKSSYPEFS